MTLRAAIWIAVSTKLQIADDKDSLPLQRADAESLCERNGWSIVATLVVPGHSRRYIDIHECARDMAAQNITAFYDLIRLWEDSAFDVLVVRDSDRFARTQTLLAYVVERTINMGARIYSLADGWIDEKNYRMWIAMGGYKAASSIDNLVKRRTEYFDNAVRRGTPISTRAVMSHKFLRDADTGRRSRIVVNEDLRHIWLDVATLLLERVGWREMDRALFQRFGHGNERGEPYHTGRMHACLTNPVFWGHSARGHRRKEVPGGWAQIGPWMWEAGHDIPPGVIIEYNTHEAIYTGDLADQVKAELFRRYERGNKGDYKTFRFSGLVVCGECGYYMTIYHNRRSLKCMSRYDKAVTRRPCEQRQAVKALDLQTWLDKRLKQAVESGHLEAFQPASDQQGLDKRIAALQTQVDELHQVGQRLIRKQATVAEDLAADYDEEIRRTRAQRKKVEDHLQALQREQKLYSSQQEDQRRALEELKRVGVDLLWDRPDGYINQLLHRLLGRRRLLALDGKIEGTTDAPTRIQRA